jgi:hypothetical protein
VRYIALFALECFQHMIVNSRPLPLLLSQFSFSLARLANALFLHCKLSKVVTIGMLHTNHGRSYILSILEAHAEPSTVNIFGPVPRGQITLNGVVMRAKCSFNIPGYSKFQDMLDLGTQSIRGKIFPIRHPRPLCTQMRCHACLYRRRY